MFQDSEIVDLLMVVFLTPVMVSILREISLAGKRWFIAGYLAIVVGYVLTLAEAAILPGLLDLLEHTAYATAGCFFLVAVVIFSRSVRRGGDS